MRGPREVLNELKWREGEDALREAEIWYVHRGAPDDTRIVPGEDVADLGRSFFALRDRGRASAIPYHRVFRIARRGEIVWERAGRAPAHADAASRGPPRRADPSAGAIPREGPAGLEDPDPSEGG